MSDPGVQPLPSFPTARHGYGRAAVDAYVREAAARVEALGRSRDRQSDELRQQGEALADLRARYERLQSATLDERSQDVLDAAADRARELVAAAEIEAAAIITAARRHADVLDERARQEYDWRRRKLAAERAELVEQQRTARLAQVVPGAERSPEGPADAGGRREDQGPAPDGRELSEQHS